MLFRWLLSNNGLQWKFSIITPNRSKRYMYDCWWHRLVHNYGSDREDWTSDRSILIILFSFNRFNANDKNNSFIHTQPIAFIKVKHFSSFGSWKKHHFLSIPICRVQTGLKPGTGQSGKFSNLTSNERHCLMISILFYYTFKILFLDFRTIKLLFANREAKDIMWKDKLDQLQKEMPEKLVKYTSFTWFYYKLILDCCCNDSVSTSLIIKPIQNVGGTIPQGENPFDRTSHDWPFPYGDQTQDLMDIKFS